MGCDKGPRKDLDTIFGTLLASEDPLFGEPRTINQAPENPLFGEPKVRRTRRRIFGRE